MMSTEINSNSEVEQSLVIVHTGDGKGKTTAALGLALRAVGCGLKVLILQFIKGGQHYGELDSIELLSNATNGRIEVRQCGLGFTNQGDSEEHKKAAATALTTARDAITSGDWQLIILDEINYAVTAKLITEDEMLSLIDIKPDKVHLVLTGRNATERLIDRADLVTEMKLIKHPFQRGIKAQIGIEF